jgi:hypothetical protein
MTQLTDKQKLEKYDHMKEQQKKHYTRYAAKQKAIRLKLQSLKVTVTQEEIDKQMKK